MDALQPFDWTSYGDVTRDVRKTGATTGTTYGEVRLVATVATYEEDGMAHDEVFLMPLHALSPFALPGDSGAVVWDEETGHALGLVAGLFIGPKFQPYVAIVPMTYVVDELNALLSGSTSGP